MSRRSARTSRRVQSTVPFAMASLPVFTWHRADTVNTSTDFVLSDKFSTRHQRQVTAGAKPTVVTGANGQPFVRFDGVDDFLISDAPASDYTYLHDATGSEVHIVVTPQSLATSWWGIGDYNGGAAWQMLRGGAANDARFLLSNNAAGATVDYSVVGALNVGTCVRFGVSLKASGSPDFAVFKNGALVTSGSIDGAARNNASTATFQLGRRANGTAFAQIDIAEIVMFTRVLTAYERAKLDKYFLSRYGI